MGAFQDGSLRVQIQLPCRSSNNWFWWEPDHQFDSPTPQDKQHYTKTSETPVLFAQPNSRTSQCTQEKTADDIHCGEVWGLFAVTSEYVLTVRCGLATSLRSDPLLFCCSPKQHPGHSPWYASVLGMFPQLSSFPHTWITFSCVLRLCLFSTNPPWWRINSVPSRPWVRHPFLDDFLFRLFLFSYFLSVYIVFTFTNVRPRVPIWVEQMWILKVVAQKSATFP